ncbi:hypothetical protein [Sphingobacterium sp. BIGb0116]
MGEEIGLISCADGGTSLNDWQVGGKIQQFMRKRNKVNDISLGFYQ